MIIITKFEHFSLRKISKLTKYPVGRNMNNYCFFIKSEKPKSSEQEIQKLLAIYSNLKRLKPLQARKHLNVLPILAVKKLKISMPLLVLISF